jgi:hypothetical protein
VKRNKKRIIGILVPVAILAIALVVLLRMHRGVLSVNTIDATKNETLIAAEKSAVVSPKAVSQTVAKSTSRKAEPAPKPAATPGEESPGALESLRSEGKPLAMLWLRGGKRIAGNVIETNEDNLLLDTGVRQVMIPVKDVLIRTPIR